MLAAGGAMLGSGGTAAVAKILDDPLSLIAERSPGSRPDGALLAAKPDKSVSPVELVAGPGRELAPTVPGAATPAGAGPASAPETLVAVLPEEPLAAAGEPGGLIQADAIVVASGGPSPRAGRPGFFSPIGSGPVGPGSSPECCSALPPPGVPGAVVPAVPEPATWMMMILGFLMVGAALRANARSAVRARAA